MREGDATGAIYLPLTTWAACSAAMANGYAGFIGTT